MAGMGCTEEYNRHWDVYNRRLVDRGALLSDLSWIPHHKDEVARMNHKKHGRPFVYGETLISYVCGLRSTTGMPFRILEGLLRTIFDAFGVVVPSYQTLWRRCDAYRASAGVPADARERVVAVDSTGIKVSMRGQWMREKWKVHKGWLKLHLLTDVHTNEILSFSVTDERSGDAGQMLALVDSAVADGHRIIKVLSDGAYDVKYIWNGMKERKIAFVPNIRKGASGKSRGCIARSMEVRNRDAIGDEEWKRIKGYNMRWKVESAISDLKRMFGESVSSKTFGRMVKELARNIECFNRMKRGS